VTLADVDCRRNLSRVIVRQVVVISLIDRLTAKQDPNDGDTERWEPYDNQSRERIMDCCLAAEILKYNKAMVLNNCVWVGITMSSVRSTPRHQCDVRKPIYRAGNRKHVAASKAASKVLTCLGSELRKVVITSSRRAMHKKQAGIATIAPRRTTEAVEKINMQFTPWPKILLMSHQTGAWSAWFPNQMTELMPWMILQKINQRMIDAEGML